LTINDKPTESIDIPKQNSTGFVIGSIHAVDLAAGGQPVANVTLNPNNSLSYPLEIVNSTILKVSLFNTMIINHSINKIEFLREERRPLIYCSLTVQTKLKTLSPVFCFLMQRINRLIYTFIKIGS
jgi:hypothetical protein